MQDISRIFARCFVAVDLNQHTPRLSSTEWRDRPNRVGFSRFWLNQSRSSSSQTSSKPERTPEDCSQATA